MYYPIGSGGEAGPFSCTIPSAQGRTSLFFHYPFRSGSERSGKGRFLSEGDSVRKDAKTPSTLEEVYAKNERMRAASPYP